MSTDDWRSLSPEDLFKTRVMELVRVLLRGAPANVQAGMDAYAAEHGSSFAITMRDDGSAFATVDGWDALELPPEWVAKLYRHEFIHGINLMVRPDIPDTVEEMFPDGEGV